MRQLDDTAAATRRPEQPYGRQCWRVRLLCADAPAPEPENGLALMWPLADVVLAHGGQQVSLREGDLAIIDRMLPVAVHGMHGWTARILEFGDRRMLYRTDERRRFIASPIDGTAKLAQIIKRIWTIGYEMEDLDLGADLIEERIVDLIAEMGSKLLGQAIDRRRSSHAAAMLDRANLLIAAHLSEADFSAAVLAERMRISSRHLSSLFAGAGTTTSRAIITARLDRAKSILADPADASRQIASIASACGFADQGYFTRCFRAEVGVSPRRYRASFAIL